MEGHGWSEEASPACIVLTCSPSSSTMFWKTSSKVAHTGRLEPGVRETCESGEVAIRGHRLPPSGTTIGGHQRPSATLIIGQHRPAAPAAVIRAHQPPSAAISIPQPLSAALSDTQPLSAHARVEVIQVVEIMGDHERSWEIMGDVLAWKSSK